MPEIKAPMTGKQLDQLLKSFLDAETPENNGKVCYIRRGTQAFESWASLSDIVQTGGGE